MGVHHMIQDEGGACNGGEALVVRSSKRGNNKRALYGGLRRLRSALCSIAKHLNLGPRRQRLTEAENTPCHTPGTPQRRCRQILGRTPTKLYSPFGIETPHCVSDPLNDSAYYPNTPEHGCSPAHKSFKSKSHVWRLLNSRPRSLFQ